MSTTKNVSIADFEKFAEKVAANNEMFAKAFKEVESGFKALTARLKTIESPKSDPPAKAKQAKRGFKPLKCFADLQIKIPKTDYPENFLGSGLVGCKIGDTDEGALFIVYHSEYKSGTIAYKGTFRRSPAFWENDLKAWCFISELPEGIREISPDEMMPIMEKYGHI